MHWWEVLQKFNKNAAEVDIAPALGKITKNLKYRSRGPGQGPLERVCQGHLLCKISHSQLSQVQRKPKFDIKINKSMDHEI